MKLTKLLSPERLTLFWKRFDARLKPGPSFKGVPCRVWMGECVQKGYGRVSFEVNGKRYRLKVHRLNYERKVGPIPRGRVLDHLCRRTNCAEPRHLEPITNSLNVTRQNAALNGSEPGVRCKNGHEGAYKRANTTGKFYCTACDRERKARDYWASKTPL